MLEFLKKHKSGAQKRRKRKLEDELREPTSYLLSIVLYNLIIISKY
jgi:hypothetical protein